MAIVALYKARPWQARAARKGGSSAFQRTAVVGQDGRTQVYIVRLVVAGMRYTVECARRTWRKDAYADVLDQTYAYLMQRYRFVRSRSVVDYDVTPTVRLPWQDVARLLPQPVEVQWIDGGWYNGNELIRVSPVPHDADRPLPKLPRAIWDDGTRAPGRMEAYAPEPLAEVSGDRRGYRRTGSRAPAYK